MSLLGEAGVGARRSLSPEGWGEDGDCRRWGKAGPGRKPLLSVVVVVAGVIDVGPDSSSSKTLPVRSHRCGQVSRTSAACGQCYGAAFDIPYEALDYTKFKAAIVEYPGGHGYNYRDLAYRHFFANSNMTTKTELIDFGRQFRPVTTWLVKNKTFSE